MSHRPTPDSRISTGNAQADEVMDGGFLPNTLNIIMGPPGSGKTVFVQQMVYHNSSPEAQAGDDRPILYLTTLSEPMGKILRFLHTFEFFAPERVGSSVIYDDISTLLAKQGIEALAPRLQEMLREQRPKIIVIDSFKAVRDLGTSDPQLRRMMHEVAAVLTAYAVTTFLVGEYDHHNSTIAPEFAVADGIVQLAREESNDRDHRFLHVRKLRGSNFQGGTHAMAISSDGVRIFPRLVTPTHPVPYQRSQERVPTGVPGLDEMVGGGLWRGSSTLVLGQTGAGKTTVALQFIFEGLRRGEPGLFLNFQENPTQLHRRIEAVGHDLSDEQRQRLMLIYRSPVELQVDTIVDEIFVAIDRHGVRRIVVDAIGDLGHATASSGRLSDYLYALTEHFAVHGVTAMLTMEGHLEWPRPRAELPRRFNQMADNIIQLDAEYDGRLERSARVYKTRNSAHSMEPRRLIIEHEGARLD